MIVDDWIEVDSMAGIEAILVSVHGVCYMQYTDAMLDDLIRTFEPEKRDKLLVRKLYAEKERRARLED